MLLEIYVENFALIDRLRLGLRSGLNVFTGETGAGKSILIDAMEAVLGGRVSADLVRTGTERAVVEAVLDVSGQSAVAARLQELGLAGPDDTTLVLTREIARSGRHGARVNGRANNASLLRELASGLVDLHGQHEQQSLLLPGRALALLDAFGGAGLLRLRDEVSRLHGELRQVEDELASLYGDAVERARRLDLLRYQLRELDAARLREGEDEELSSERRLLQSAERRRAATEAAYAMLYEAGDQPAASDLVGRALAELRDGARLDPELQGFLEVLEGALAQLQDAARDLSAYRDRVEANPARLEEIEQRLDLLASLRRKYGGTIGEMLRYRQEMASELERLGNAEELAARLDSRRADLGGRLQAAATRLSAAREEAAGRLSLQATAELRELGLPEATLAFAVEPERDGERLRVGQHGADRVNIMFTANVGEPPRPLVRVASGGELSRVMLALKVVLASHDAVPTLIFDEVDAGLGGRAAQAVSDRLRLLGQTRQVLAVTHLAGIAAAADAHFALAKEVRAERTTVAVTALDEEGRVRELSRMLGGARITRATEDHAREMLAQSRTGR